MRYEIGQANRLGNRSSNQDRFAALEHDGAVLLVLADGMGGHKGGEIAAQMLIDTAREVFRDPVTDVPGFLTALILRTHQAILRYANQHGFSTPPGTTGVLCLIQDGMAQWAHAGDSRLYLFRRELPLYRTRDHSYVEQLYRRGEIRESEKSQHPMRNQITQCIGCMTTAPEVEVGRPAPIAPGDLIVLCSDGLWNALDDMQIGALAKRPDLDRAVDALAWQAEKNSYPNADNISVLALRLVAHDPPGAGKSAPQADAAPENPPPKERLRDAIEQIEQAIKQYEKEMGS